MIYITIGIVLALLVICIEYEWWAKAKNKKRFHFIGFTSVFLVCMGIFYAFNWDLIVISIISLSYWNAFELLGNHVHGQEWLYVGATANFDKQIRKFKNFKAVKLLMHIISILGILILTLL